jgi:hypothetical protein
MMAGAEIGRGGAAPAPAHQSFLVHKGFRWLKSTTVLMLLCLVPYVAWQPAGGHNGGTWLGYTLGTIGALLIAWLMLLGIRKRRYGPGSWSLKNWLSAHVYFGLSLVLIASLHAGFQVGWNIHTLAYALMILVIASGIWGTVAYVRLPRLMTTNRQGQTFDELTAAILGLDREAANQALALGDEFADVVRQSREETRLGGSAWRQITARDPRCGTAKALARARGLVGGLPPQLAKPGETLLVTLGRKQELLRRARRDISYKALMDLWLYTHVPLSFALLAALTAHIVSVFFYWG